MKGSANDLGLLGVAIFRTGPEETLEAILGAAGDDVHVKVGHALADAVVHGDERSGGSESGFDGAAEVLGDREEGLEQVDRELRQGFDVEFGNEEGMAGEEGAVIEEGQGAVVLEDDGGVDPAGGDFAEEARGHGTILRA